ncbi:MAG: BrnA antitoxin family protein [Terracidiphilus sp.]
MKDAIMKRGNPEPLTPELQAELDTLALMPDSEIDTTEMPPVTNWNHAVRGPFYRPIKRPLSLRIDADILDWFQRQGQGYQTRMNFALREYVERHREHA